MNEELEHFEFIENLSLILVHYLSFNRIELKFNNNIYIYILTHIIFKIKYQILP